MDQTKLTELSAWITETGLAGQPETGMMGEFCARAAAAGLPIADGIVVVDTLHPLYEGHAIRWRRDGEERVVRIEYGRTNEGPAAESYRRSPYYHLLQSGEPMLRRRLTLEGDSEFELLATARRGGMTDYVAFLARFAAEGVIGDMDCIYSSWCTDRPEGFAEADVAALGRLFPYLAIAMKCAALGRVARALAETYLGRDAGRLVLGGRIARGVAEKIDAVLWFSDLSGYTKITDTAAPDQIIPMLNDYAEAIVSAVQAEGGDVLKLIGDGVLAIFRADARPRACLSAIEAAAAARQAIVELNQRRDADSLPTTHMYLGLHVGKVFFGNIGSKDRLDFTVVGPAVNEVSRIAAMCRSVDQPLLVSAGFAAALGEAGPQLVSVGRYALRGVGLPQELFTLDPGREPDRLKPARLET
ncbi:MAG TPA: adenylate/guanylate cyclase domain-containing protein [Candidatus Udaeobacter sp.]|nr:adenylate/guanylate cyclase domain-containing protein [Candidatus Udaeobacter sp.]